MKAPLLPFTKPPEESATTIEEGRSLIGTLNFAIIKLGKAFMAELRTVEIAANKAAPHGKASGASRFRAAPEARHHAQMWIGLGIPSEEIQSEGFQYLKLPVDLLWLQPYLYPCCAHAPGAALRAEVFSPVLPPRRQRHPPTSHDLALFM